MKRDLLTLLRHGIVVTTVLVVDGTIKIVIDIAQRNGFMKDDVAKLCSEITSYFMVLRSDPGNQWLQGGQRRDSIARAALSAACRG
jgi:hypothetical protein